MNYVRAVVLMSIVVVLMAGIGWVANGQPGALLAAALVTMFLMVVMWRANSVIVELHGGQEVDANDSSPIHRAFVADAAMLAKRARVDTPRTFVVDLCQPNAFVTGRDSGSSSIVVTTGLLQTLTRSEARAIIAHELAHLSRGDILSMAIMSSIAGLAAFPAGCIGSLIGRRRQASAWVARFVTRLAMSRTREHAADRMAGDICGSPLQLARALEKIERCAAAMVNPVAERYPAAAHLYVLDPLIVSMGSKDSTHPATCERVTRLRRQATLAAIALSGADVEMA